MNSTSWKSAFVFVFALGILTVSLSLPSYASGNDTCTSCCTETPTANAGKPLVHLYRLTPTVPKSCFPIGTNAVWSVGFALTGYALHRSDEAKEPWSNAGVTAKAFGAGAVLFITQTLNAVTDCLNQAIFNPPEVVIEKAK